MGKVVPLGAQDPAGTQNSCRLTQISLDDLRRRQMLKHSERNDEVGAPRGDLRQIPAVANLEPHSRITDQLSSPVDHLLRDVHTDDLIEAFRERLGDAAQARPYLDSELPAVGLHGATVERIFDYTPACCIKPFEVRSVVIERCIHVPDGVLAGATIPVVPHVGPSIHLPSIVAVLFTRHMAPRVSVVVPVKDRRQLLELLLESLERQTYRDFEVIVVDDGSAPGSLTGVGGRTVAGVPITLLRNAGAGAVAARRTGVAASQGEILAFIDSDCQASPKWIDCGVAALDDGADLVNGPTRPQRLPKWGERSVWSAKEGLYPTCNMFYRREAYDSVGGFDDGVVRGLGFRFDRRAKGLGLGEDTILAWRLIRSGARHTFAEDAVVEHHVFAVDPPETLSRELMIGAFPALVREVPELRRTLLKGGVMLGPPNRIPIYAILFFSVVGWSGWIPVGLAWWIALRLRPDPSSEQLALERISHLPLQFAVDATGAFALLLGSVRARRLVL